MTNEKMIMEDEPKCKEICDRELIAVVNIKDLIRELVLIKKYALEKDDERIYLCADHIERELHMANYGNAIIEHGW